MPEWRPIDFEGSQAQRLAAEKGERLDVYWTEFNTLDDAEREQLIAFIVHPLDSLTGSGDSAVSGLQLDGVDETWRVVTVLHNHHRGLNPRITRMMATVSDEEQTVYLNGHKQSE